MTQDHHITVTTYITGMSLGSSGICYILLYDPKLVLKIMSFFFNMVVSSSDLLSVFLHIGVPHHLTFLFAFNSCGPGNQITRLMKVIFNRKHKL